MTTASKDDLQLIRDQLIRIEDKIDTRINSLASRIGKLEWIIGGCTFMLLSLGWLTQNGFIDIKLKHHGENQQVALITSRRE